MIVLPKGEAKVGHRRAFWEEKDILFLLKKRSKIKKS